MKENKSCVDAIALYQAVGPKQDIQRAIQLFKDLAPTNTTLYLWLANATMRHPDRFPPEERGIEGAKNFIFKRLEDKSKRKTLEQSPPGTDNKVIDTLFLGIACSEIHEHFKTTGCYRTALKMDQDPRIQAAYGEATYNLALSLLNISPSMAIEYLTVAAEHQNADAIEKLEQLRLEGKVDWKPLKGDVIFPRMFDSNASNKLVAEARSFFYPQSSHCIRLTEFLFRVDNKIYSEFIGRMERYYSDSDPVPFLMTVKDRDILAVVLLFEYHEKNKLSKDTPFDHYGYMFYGAYQLLSYPSKNIDLSLRKRAFQRIREMALPKDKLSSDFRHHWKHRYLHLAKVLLRNVPEYSVNRVEALSLLEEIVHDKDPAYRWLNDQDKAEAYILLARCYIEGYSNKHTVQDAIKLLQDVRRFKKTNPEFTHKDERFKTVLSSEAQLPVYNYLLGVLHELEGKNQKARESYQKSILPEASEAYAEICYNMATSHLGEKYNIKEAQLHLDEAVKLGHFDACIKKAELFIKGEIKISNPLSEAFELFLRALQTALITKHMENIVSAIEKMRNLASQMTFTTEQQASLDEHISYACAILPTETAKSYSMHADKDDRAVAVNRTINFLGRKTENLKKLSAENNMAALLFLGQHKEIFNYLDNTKNIETLHYYFYRALNGHDDTAKKLFAALDKQCPGNIEKFSYLRFLIDIQKIISLENKAECTQIILANLSKFNVRDYFLDNLKKLFEEGRFYYTCSPSKKIEIADALIARLSFEERENLEFFSRHAGKALPFNPDAPIVAEPAHDPAPQSEQPLPPPAAPEPVLASVPEPEPELKPENVPLPPLDRVEELEVEVAQLQAEVERQKKLRAIARRKLHEFFPAAEDAAEEKGANAKPIRRNSF